MIALQSLKYKIFECCMDILVNKISINFRTNPNLIKVNINDIHIKSYLSEIIITGPHYVKKYIFAGCKICTIFKINNIPVALGFGFDTLNGNKNPKSGPYGIRFENNSLRWDSRQGDQIELYI